MNTGLTGVIEASDTVTSAAVEVDVGRAKIVNRATTISKVTLDVVFLSDEPARNAVVEVPARDSTVSGVGIISGWSCLGGDLKAEISDADGIIATFPLAHGISRGDTESECGDTLNGFSATMNWNLLRPAGEKTLRLIQNGEEVASHTFSVVAFEKEFITGSGTATVNDFPTAGRSVTLDWDESQQSFVITEIN